MHLEIWRKLQSVYAAWNARWGRHVIAVLRWGIPILLIAWLGYSLTRLGWAQVWSSRPTGLGFYVVLLLQFYIQPYADLLIYRYLLRAGPALTITAMMRKRYVNNMLDYSGEVYFFFWAHKALGLRKTALAHAVKDSNVLSASAGLVMVWLTLLAVLLSGGVRLPETVNTGIWSILLVGSLPIALGVALFAGGRKVTTLSRRDMMVTFGIHLTRAILNLGVDFVVWWLSGALPNAAACLQFIALRVLVTRLPLVPNKDLLFVGVGIAAAGMLNVSAPKVAAVLVLMTAIGLVQNLVQVGLPWLFEQFQSRRRAAVS